MLLFLLFSCRTCSNSTRRNETPRRQKMVEPCPQAHTVGDMRGELLEAERVQLILNAFFTVYNYYGYGLNEAVYAGALECELRARGQEVVRELAVSVAYHGRHIAWQRLDMVVDDAVIVEAKATEKLSPAAKPQILSYLRASRFQVGILLHFGPSPRFYRFIDSPKRRHGAQ
jgi:GxxExxY protein